MNQRSIKLADLMAQRAQELRPVELRLFRRALALGLPEFIDWAYRLAKGSDQAGSTDQAHTTLPPSGDKDA